MSHNIGPTGVQKYQISQYILSIGSENLRSFRSISQHILTRQHLKMKMAVQV